jgi:molybdopterin converting factor subunit 1
MGTVRVRLFARLADIAGTREVEVELGEGLTAGDVFALMSREHPRMAGMKVAFAVNQVYADGEQPLREGDELALIPPVSGGACAPRGVVGSRSRVVADGWPRSASTFDSSVFSDVDGGPSIPQDERNV